MKWLGFSSLLLGMIIISFWVVPKLSAGLSKENLVWLWYLLLPYLILLLEAKIGSSVVPSAKKSIPVFSWGCRL